MKKLLLSLLLCLTLGSAAAWAEEYTATMATGLWKSNNTSATITDATTDLAASWNIAVTYKKGSNWSITSDSQGRGIQFGSSRHVFGTLKLSTTDIPGKITKITINTCGASKATVNLTASVGGEAFKCGTATSVGIEASTTATSDYTFIGEGEGEILLTWTQTTEKAIYIKSFTIEYTEQTGPVTPGEVVLVNGDAINDELTVAQGDKVKFTSEKAAKLVATIEGNLVNDTETAEGAEYTHTADFTKYGDEYLITVTPCDSEGTEYKDLAKSVMLTKKAAELCGEVTFTPAGEVSEGTAVKLACENAVQIFYAIDGGEELEYNDETGIIITEACTITAYGVNADGVPGNTASAEYSIKEADRYVLLRHASDIKPGKKYILFGLAKNSTDNKGALMGANYTNNKYRTAIENVDFSEIITIDDKTKAAVIAIENLNETNDAGALYSIQAEGEDFLGTVNSTYTSNQDLKYYATVGTNSKFNITIDSATGIAKIVCGTQQLYYNATNPRFKTYYTAQSPVYIYRLIDDEYDDFVPAELHVHGDFYDTSWERSEPMVKDGKVFTFVDLWVQDHDGSHSLVLATCALDPNVSTTPQAARRKAPAASYWADNGLEGHVLVPTAEGTLTRVPTSEHTTDESGVFTVAEPYKYYNLTADFSGYGAPTFTISEGRDIPTGVSNINADANAPVEFFNLQGVRVANPESGIYIRRQGKTVSKVYVK